MTRNDRPPVSYTPPPVRSHPRGSTPRPPGLPITLAPGQPCPACGGAVEVIAGSTARCRGRCGLFYVMQDPSPTEE